MNIEKNPKTYECVMYMMACACKCTDALYRKCTAWPKKKNELAIDIQNAHLLRDVVQLYDEQYEILNCHSLLFIDTSTLQVCSSIHFSCRFHFEHRINNKSSIIALMRFLVYVMLIQVKNVQTIKSLFCTKLNSTNRTWTFWSKWI